MSKHPPLVYDLRDQARRHNLKLQGNGRLTKATIESHKRLICEAVQRLSHLPAGETTIVESNRDDVFVVVRSLETKAPRRCECCPGYTIPASHFPAANRDKIIVDQPAHKPSPPGRT
jgi:hypothetical protein